MDEPMGPYKIKTLAGKPYRPSNGTEGEMFIEAFCARCVHEEFLHTLDERSKKCDLLSNSMVYEPGDPDYPKEWIHDAEGRPICTAFEVRP